MLVTVDIPAVEVASVGPWIGHDADGRIVSDRITSDDLDALVAAAAEAVVDIPLKLGHDTNQTLLQADGYPAAGWVKGLRRSGDFVLADLCDVPAVIGDLVRIGGYRKRSAEITWNARFGNRVYPVMLTAVALLGSDLPAVHNLRDIVEMYDAARSPSELWATTSAELERAQRFGARVGLYSSRSISGDDLDALDAILGEVEDLYHGYLAAVGGQCRVCARSEMEGSA